MALEDLKQTAETFATEWRQKYPLTGKTDHAAAEGAVKTLYWLARLAEPKHFVWAGSYEQYQAITKNLKGLYDQTQYQVAVDLEDTDRLPPHSAVRDTWFSFRAPLMDTDHWYSSYQRNPLFNRTGLQLDSIRKGLGCKEAYYAIAPHLSRNQVPNIAHVTGYRGDSEGGGNLLAPVGRFAQQSAMQIMFYRRVGEGTLPPIQREAVDAYLTLFKSAGVWEAFEGGVVFCELPTVLIANAQRNLNNDSGPAIAYPDGWKGYFINGVQVPEVLITEPKKLTIDQVLAQTNTEVRRVMIEKMGAERFKSEAKCTLRDDDPVHGKLWETNVLQDDWYNPRRKDSWGRWRMMDRVPRPAVFLEVVNSTPEPDGSRHTFFLRMPPNLKTAKGARANLLGVRKNEMDNLLVET